MPSFVWASYLGSLASLCDGITVISDGAMASAVLEARRQFPGANVFDRRTTPPRSAGSQAERDLFWHVTIGLKEPKPACYVAGPYSSNPSHCTVRAFARAALLMPSYCPVIPFVAHDLDCAMPREYEHWLEFDAHLLRKCRYFCRGFGNSRGADLEAALASELRIETVPDVGHESAEREWLAPAIALLRTLPDDTKGL